MPVRTKHALETAIEAGLSVGVWTDKLVREVMP